MPGMLLATIKSVRGYPYAVGVEPALFQMQCGGMKTMKRTGIVIAVGALFCLDGAAQAQSGAQAGAQSSNQASVQAGQTQTQASSNTSVAGSASAQNGQANASLASGTAFNAALSSPVDSKKCKPGDAVAAHTTEPVKSEGKTVIPKGSKLVGHVTQASARANGQAESTLGIVFDKAILKNGEEIPLNVAIQALASAGKNVNVDSGTRMLLVTQAQAGEQGTSKQPAASKPEPKSERKSQPNRPEKP